jgi:hypothetical protein
MLKKNIGITAIIITNHKILKNTVRNKTSDKKIDDPFQRTNVNATANK